MTVYILYNPSSGNGRATQLVATLKKAYPELSYALFATDKATDEKRHIKTILSQFEPSRDRFLIIGGDGTLSKSLSYWPADLPFAYLPAGSGNDFARSLGGLTMAQVMRSLLNHAPKATTVLANDQQVVVNSLDATYAAQTVALSEQSGLKKGLNRFSMGKLVYILLGIKALFVTRPVSVRLRVNGQLVDLDNLFFFSVSNNTFFGGGVTIWTSSHVTRKEMVCVWAKDRGIFGNLLTLVTILLKGHEKSKHLSHLVVQEVEIEFEKPELVQIDGDLTELSSINLICQTRWIYS
ncbi:diacylglycerol kinase family protein [Streptococcus sp. E17BB]|uniref:diacylglycerol/lipid kinase family protein n=1 Tax=Streptococcus sp. E17BB TaxID=3278714 RepID=UPI00359E8D92